MTIVCKKHGETPAFHPKGRNPRCSRCASEAVSKRRKALKQMAVDHMGGKCSRCGYDRCVEALQFHHTDPTKKDFGISAHGVTRSWAKIKLELDKCILVCGNCHMEIHSEEYSRVA